jgi:hypothetical protein
MQAMLAQDVFFALFQLFTTAIYAIQAGVAYIYVHWRIKEAFRVFVYSYRKWLSKIFQYLYLFHYQTPPNCFLIMGTLC